MVYADNYKKYCYPILTYLMVDYKEQVLVMGIEINMQYLIYHILLIKKVSNPVFGAVDLLINLKSA